MLKIKFLAKAVIAVVAVSAAIIYAQRPGAVTTINYEGAEIVLHADSTWSFAKPAIISATENDDVFITLKDNRILWLKPDFTYTYTRTQPKSNRPKDFPVVTVTATATRIDVDGATKMAMDDVYNKAAAQLHRFIPTNYKDKKKAQAYVLACLKDEVKENEVDQAYNQIKGGHWKVDTKIHIQDFRSKKIVECLDLQLQPDEGEKK